MKRLEILKSKTAAAERFLLPVNSSNTSASVSHHDQIVMQNLNVLCLMLGFTSTAAIACPPVYAPKVWEESATRVKSNFDGAQFVVTADVINVKKRTMLSPERATFRVVHAFKGSLKSGDTFNVDSGITACGRGVLDRDWITLRPRNSAYPKRWLIYYTPPPVIEGPGPQLPPFEITTSPLSRPSSWATYDIDVLRRSASIWKAETTH